MSDDPIARLEAKAANDPALRAALLADPRAAIEELTGEPLPADWRVLATEQPDGAVTVGFVNDELPIDYLELVSGGADFRAFTSPGAWARPNPSCD